MFPTQLDAMAQRVGLGVARNGGLGEHTMRLFFAILQRQ